MVLWGAMQLSVIIHDMTPSPHTLGHQQRSSIWYKYLFLPTYRCILYLLTNVRCRRNHSLWVYMISLHSTKRAISCPIKDKNADNSVLYSTQKMCKHRLGVTKREKSNVFQCSLHIIFLVKLKMQNIISFFFALLLLPGITFFRKDCISQISSTLYFQ